MLAAKQECHQGFIADALESVDQAIRWLDLFEFDGVDDAGPAERAIIADAVADMLDDRIAAVLPPEAVGHRVRDIARQLADERAAERLRAMGCEAAVRAYFPPLVAPGEDIGGFNAHVLLRQDAEIREFIKDAVALVAAWKAGGEKTPGRRVLFSGAQGSGKTTSAGRAAVEFLQPGQVMWLAEQTTKKVAEEVDKLIAYAIKIGRKINIVGVYGYGALVPGSLDTMCRRGTIASAMARAGFSVRQTMCQGCRFAETCGTKGMLAEIEEAKNNGLPTIYVMVHDYLKLPHCPAPRPDILICDEDFELVGDGAFEPGAVRRMLSSGSVPTDPIAAAAAAAAIDAALHDADPLAALAAIGWDAVFGQLRLIRAGLDPLLAKEIIDRTTKLVRKAPAGAKVPHRAGATMRMIRDAVTADEAVAFFDEIVGALQGGAPMHQLLAHGQDVLFRRLKAMIRHINVIEGCNAITAGRGLTDQECQQLLSRVPDRSAFRSKWLYKQIRREIEAGCAARRGTFNSILMRDDKVCVWWLKPLNVAARTPVLALDGTGIYQRHLAKWGPRLEREHYRVERRADVTQCLGGFSRQSFLGHLKNGKPYWPEKALVRRTKLRQLAEKYADGDPEQVLFVATKQVEALMIEEQGLDRICKTGHFGALRGINAFELCGVVIVAGREQISPRDATDAARAYLATNPEPIAVTDAEEYIKETRYLRMRDGSVQPVEVDVHPDRRVQQIVVEAIREAELAQTVDRVRAIFNDRQIVILASVVLDITVDRIAADLDELLAGGSRVELAARQLGGRVLPLVPGEHVRLGLATTIDQAKGVLDRRASNDHLRQVLPGRYLAVVEYRPLGGPRRGPRPRAVVGVDDGMDLRVLLEAAVGPVEAGYTILENLRLAA